MGAGCVELCPARWNVSAARQRRSGQGLERFVFEDETQAALEAAQKAGLLDDLVLADRAIGDTLAAVAKLLLATLTDLASPAGWARIRSDLRCAPCGLALSLTFTRTRARPRS